MELIIVFVVGFIVGMLLMGVIAGGGRAEQDAKTFYWKKAYYDLLNKGVKI